jgi:hypothetical protein
LLSSSLAQPNPEEPKEKQQEAVELEIEGIEMKDMENLVEVVDEMLGFEEPGPAPGPDPKTCLSQRERIAELFDLPPVSKVTVGNVTVWVEFLSCFSAGIFARVMDQDQKETLGVLKTANLVFDSLSVQAVCKKHKPAGKCKCWVTCSDASKRHNVIRDLLKWLGSSSAGMDQHLKSSSDLRLSYGMKLRK